MALTQEQIQIVHSTVPILREHGFNITDHFYSMLLTEHPLLNGVFNKTNQASKHQAAALANALYLYAENIDDLGVLSPTVEKICQKHASLFIQPEQYDIVGEYLLRAMKDVLGDALTEDVQQAWLAAYWQLANLMMSREHGLIHSSTDWNDWKKFRVTEKVKESNEITSFYLKADDGMALPTFSPGQYISVRLYVPELGHEQCRQYSLSDAPGLEYYRISVKREAGPERLGYMSNLLHSSVHTGDLVEVSHPRGEFFLDLDTETGRPVVLLAGGVGLTPMMSIINKLTTMDRGFVTFVHTAKSSAARAFATHCSNLSRTYPHFHYIRFVTAEADETAGSDYDFKGRMDLKTLHYEDLLLQHPQTLYFVCGPESFMVDTAAGLRELGIPKERIRTEIFGTGLVSHKA